ncbi:MAG TPA: serine hydrolase [bacterium]|nr:serine hydrolase [bacterium]HPR87664.1 serine hydrolase [bacterium]
MKRLLSLLLLLGLALTAQSQSLRPGLVDTLVQRTMTAFDVPGIAVAVVKDSQVVLARGYGVRSIATGRPMDENTLFAIASNTKAFTAAALGILVDEGKLRWDTRVTDLIPEFRLHDPWVTAEFTIRDLLTHRSGLGLGAGDLMIWPDSARFTTPDLIHNLQFLQPASSFRTKYDYDNLLYIVAGEVVARASGTSWEEFVESRILRPLGMVRSAASINRLPDTTNIIDAHVPVDGRLRVVPKERGNLLNPAGGIYSSVAEMCRWVILQINRGKYGENPEQRIFSEKVHAEMWTPQTIIPVRNSGPYNAHFSAYGLGWGLTDVKGWLQASHTGGLMGIVTQVTILPEIKLGIIVFTNQQEGAAFAAVTNTIKDFYLGMAPVDRVEEWRQRRGEQNTDAAKVVEAVQLKIAAQLKSKAFPDRAPYVGLYTDRWFGDVALTLERGRMRFQALRSPKLRGEMFWYAGNTFVVRWDDRTLDADAFAIFTLDAEGQPAAMTMQAISPLTDFSFDFQDLDFSRKE